MKEPIVYLPVSRNASGMFPDVLVFSADEVVAALESAGVKWVQEDPKDYQIRMMKLQIEELKRAYVELQDQHIELRNVCTTLDDQNAALKMTARTAQERLDAVLGEYKA